MSASTLPATGGCNTGGCSSGSSGYQTLPAQLGYGMQNNGGYMPAINLPAQLGYGMQNTEVSGDYAPASTLPALIAEEDVQADEEEE